MPTVRLHGLVESFGGFVSTAVQHEWVVPVAQRQVGPASLVLDQLATWLCAGAFALLGSCDAVRGDNELFLSSTASVTHWLAN
jgi:hypothetical protein